jgi:hypothetical protein
MEAGWFKRNDCLHKDEKICATIYEENFLTLETRITNFAAIKSVTFDSKEKRSLWRELQELKYSLLKSSNVELVLSYDFYALAYSDRNCFSRKTRYNSWKPC